MPVLDVSLELSRLGLMVRAPYDLLMWLFRRVGISGYWPIVYLFLGSGLLLFSLGTLALLSARVREKDVADFWMQRVSRHSQYLGWILWSYGVYLLFLRGMYPQALPGHRCEPTLAHLSHLIHVPGGEGGAPN